MDTQRFDSHLVSFNNPASFAAEQYQTLRLTIERMARSTGAQVLAVTSPAAGEGKTVTAINLAGALARGSEARVLLVDADLRRPAVARNLGLEDGLSNGLADVVASGSATLAGCARPLAPFNVGVVPAGTPRPAIHRLLRSPRLEQAIAQARQDYDYVVIDTPPLLPVVDTALLARLVDGVIVVVAANQTPRKLLGEALNLIDPAKVLGIVFNRDDQPMFGYYDEYYKEYFPEDSRAAGHA